MQKLRTLSILSALFLLLISVSGCMGTGDTPVEVPREIVVKRVPVDKAKPIVPSVGEYKNRDVTWVVITPENAEEKFASLKGDKVFIALTADGYEHLSLNLNDLRSLIQQYKGVIKVYEDQY